MPNATAEQLKAIAAGLMEAAGAKPEHAAIIARHTTGANLAGHDSHGIILVPTYIERIKRDHIEPLAEFEVLFEIDRPSLHVGLEFRHRLGDYGD